MQKQILHLGYTSCLLYEFGINHVTIVNLSVFICNIGLICHSDIVGIKVKE